MVLFILGQRQRAKTPSPTGGQPLAARIGDLGRGECVQNVMRLRDASASGKEAESFNGFNDAMSQRPH